jgi:hypothetical protein
MCKILLYTKTGRRIAIGKVIGSILARGRRSNVNITDTKIEILDGVNEKDTLVKIVPYDHPTNIYKGVPEIWVDKNKLQTTYFDQDIKDAINSALPSHLKGNITICDEKILISKKHNFWLFIIVVIIFIIYF